MPFVIRVKTDNAGTSLTTQFTIPFSTFGATSQNFTVTAVAVAPTVGTLVGEPVTHTLSNTNLTLDFTAAGTYDLTITGPIRGIRFNDGGDRLKLLEIKEWGTDWQPGNAGGSTFFGCSNLVVTATDVPTFTTTPNLGQMFRSCSSVTDVSNFGQWATGSVTGMFATFRFATSFLGTLSNISTLNVSSATNLASFFQSVDPGFNLDISEWQPISCTDFGGAAEPFLSGTGRAFSTSIYNSILYNWSLLALQPNNDIVFGESQYDIGGNAEQSRFYLTTKVLSQACTFTANTITAVAHGLVLDNVITFTTAGTLPTGLTAGTRYWVVNPAADTFQISETKGGAAITFAADDTSTHTVEGGFNWTITDGGSTGVQQPAEGDTYIFTNSTPVLDGDNNPVQNAKVVLMRYDKLEALTAGAVNQADIVMGVALTDASGNFSVNVTAFTNFDPLQDYIGICYKDGTPILTYVPVKITPVAEV